MLMNMLGQNNQQNENNVSHLSYPKEAYSNQNNLTANDNVLPMLLSILKNNPSISQIFSNKKEKGSSEIASLPNDEILL